MKSAQQHIQLFSPQNINKLHSQSTQQPSINKIQKKSISKIRLTSPLSYRVEQPQSIKQTTKNTSFLTLHKNEVVPSKVYDYHEMVAKKGCLLRRKLKINNSRMPLPNIVDIKQSIKDDKLSFARCMNRQLDSTGNAFLLNHLRRDVPCQRPNYLKQAHRNAKKQRKYLIKGKEEATGCDLILPPLLDTRESSGN